MFLKLYITYKAIFSLDSIDTRKCTLTFLVGPLQLGNEMTFAEFNESGHNPKSCIVTTDNSRLTTFTFLPLGGYLFSEVSGNELKLNFCLHRKGFSHNVMIRVLLKTID